jgi:hypothetical protein
VTVAFLSYTMRDGVLDPGLLEEIAYGLRGVHEFIYVDLLHNDSDRPQQHLEGVLKCSTTLYVLQTPGALLSPWVRREISLARCLGIAVTPVPQTLARQVRARGDMPDARPYEVLSRWPKTGQQRWPSLQ